MKKISKSILFSVFCVMDSPVFAATGDRIDDSHLLTYIFLAVCGLIIILQLVPVVSIIKELLKFTAARQTEMGMKKLKTATSKYR